MSGPKNDNAIARTISLPDDIWDLVDEQSSEWRTSRSATVRRMIHEWKKAQSATQKNKRSDPAMIAV